MKYMNKFRKPNSRHTKTIELIYVVSLIRRSLIVDNVVYYLNKKVDITMCKWIYYLNYYINK